jgi:hypothetical protein
METTSLKVRVATFAAGALSVAMIPAGLANDNVGAMLGFKNDAQTHVEAEGSDDGSVMLHQGAESDVDGNVQAAHDNHGADVTAAAHAKTEVSGETHGDAVSAVARQKTHAATDAKVHADDTDLDVDASSHASGDVTVDADDDSVNVHGTAETDASAHADASHGHDGGGLIDGLLDVGGDEDSNDDEDGSSSNLLDDLDLDLL